jgi:hypothetical protein
MPLLDKGHPISGSRPAAKSLMDGREMMALLVEKHRRDARKAKSKALKKAHNDYADGIEWYLENVFDVVCLGKEKK